MKRWFLVGCMFYLSQTVMLCLSQDTSNHYSSCLSTLIHIWGLSSFDRYQDIREIRQKNDIFLHICCVYPIFLNPLVFRVKELSLIED